MVLKSPQEASRSSSMWNLYMCDGPVGAGGGVVMMMVMAMAMVVVCVWQCVWGGRGGDDNGDGMCVMVCGS